MNHSTFSRMMPLVLAIAAGTLLGSAGPAECQFSVRLFTVGSNSTIRLSSNWCVQVEPENGAFQITDINVDTMYLFSLNYPLLGDVDRIYPMNKTYIVGDRDGNGIADMQVCFSSADLNQLFSKVHGNKPTSAYLGLTGSLVNGGWFSGNITIDVYAKQ